MRITVLFTVMILLSSCAGKEDKSKKENETLVSEYLQKGGEIAGSTQGELLKNVSQAMKTGGPVHAVDFCNLRAMVLTDSLSDLYNCEIKRISSKYRNPLSKPRTESETAQLSRYQQAFEQGDTLMSEVYFFDDRTEYFQPIFLAKGACLLCHGKPGVQIAEETLEMIKSRYPADMATDYALNDFRGAWKITFMKE